MNATPWRVQLTHTAERDLRRLDPQVRERINSALASLTQHPRASAS